MDAAGDQLFPCAAFAQKQYGIFVLAHLFDHFINALHFHGDADEPAETRPSLQLFPQEAVLLLEFDGAGHAFEARAQLFDAEGLGNVIHGAHARDLHGGFDGAVLRQHHNSHVRVEVVDEFQEFHTAGTRKFQVRQENVDCRMFQNLKSLFSSGHGHGLHARLCGDRRAGLTNRLFIVHNQDTHGDHFTTHGRFFSHDV